MSVHRLPDRRPAVRPYGLSLIEVLVALGVFAVVSVGVLSVLGATAAGGLQDASPTALSTGRRARDLTVAAVYVQALHDFLASRDDAVWDAVVGTWPPGAAEQAYCIRPDVTTSCDGGEPVLPALLGDFPVPQAAPYQLNWTRVHVVVRRWVWDCAAQRYVAWSSGPTRGRLLSVHSTLLWRSWGAVRTVAAGERSVGRVLPSRRAMPDPSGEVCP